MFFTLLMECLHSLWPNWKVPIDNGICYPLFYRKKHGCCTEQPTDHQSVLFSAAVVLQVGVVITVLLSCTVHLYCIAFLYCICETLNRVYQLVFGHQVMTDGSCASYLHCRGISICGSSAVDYRYHPIWLMNSLA